MCPLLPARLAVCQYGHPSAAHPSPAAFRLRVRGSAAHC
jgi:hypothetical protein